METESDVDLVKCTHTPERYPSREVILRQLSAPRRAAGWVRPLPGGQVRCVLCGQTVGRCGWMARMEGGAA